MERPILFSGPMVRAILEGRKTQTRRVVKLPSDMDWYLQSSSISEDGDVVFADEPTPEQVIMRELVTCPYGVPGDRLWVRETFAAWRHTSVEYALEWDTIEGNLAQAIELYGRQNIEIAYRADADDSDGWRPSIFMPRWASRITLEIVKVRVERVQDIRGPEILKEGIGLDSFWDKNLGDNTSGGQFRHLWDSINEKRGFGWDKNPWVWVVEFKRVQP